MAYPVSKLVTNAYHMAGLVAREFEQVSGQQSEVGFDTLNDLLADKTLDKGVIPYFTSDAFTAVAGQSEYDIDDLIEVSTLTFTKDTVRYPVQNLSRDRFQGSARANDISSLPLSFHMERQLNGAKIFLYFVPDQAYDFTIWGKFRLSEVTSLNQDLEQSLDRFYINFLKAELAERLCIESDFEVPQGVQKLLARYQTRMKNISAKLDLKQRKLSTLDDMPSTINYGQANLGNGWT